MSPPAKPKIVTFLEIERTTQRKVVFVNQDCLGKDAEPKAHHGLPTVYLSKDWFNRVLGGYPVIKITIEPAYEEETVGQDDL